MTTVVAASSGLDQRRRVISGIFFAVMALVLFVMMAGLVGELLPEGIAGRISRNSESVCFVLLLSLWIQIGLPRSRAGRPAWLPLAVAGALLAVGVGLLLSPFPSTVKTVNEPVIAVAVLVLYTSIRRPLPRWAVVIALLIPLAVIVTGVVLARPEAGERMVSSNVVIQQLETLLLVLLAVVALDVVDRGILDNSARTRRAIRWTFYGLLLAVPLGVVALGGDGRIGADLFSLVLNVLGRSHEAFLGTLLLCLYFAVGLGRVGRTDSGQER